MLNAKTLKEKKTNVGGWGGVVFRRRGLNMVKVNFN